MIQVKKYMSSYNTVPLREQTKQTQEQHLNTLAPLNIQHVSSQTRRQAVDLFYLRTQYDVSSRGVTGIYNL